MTCQFFAVGQHTPALGKNLAKYYSAGIPGMLADITRCLVSRVFQGDVVADPVHPQ